MTQEPLDMTAEDLAAEIDRIGAQVARAGAELQNLAGRCKRRKQTAASLKSWGNVTLALGLELRRQAGTVNTAENGYRRPSHDPRNLDLDHGPRGQLLRAPRVGD